MRPKGRKRQSPKTRKEDEEKKVFKKQIIHEGKLESSWVSVFSTSKINSDTIKKYIVNVDLTWVLYSFLLSISSLKGRIKLSGSEKLISSMTSPLFESSEAPISSDAIVGEYLHMYIIA